MHSRSEEDDTYEGNCRLTVTGLTFIMDNGFQLDVAPKTICEVRPICKKHARNSILGCGLSLVNMMTTVQLSH
jgi:hypothetical protein